MAGTVVKIGPGVEGFSVGDQVFAMADNTYAQLCVVNAAVLAKIPKGLDLIQAAALPLVTTTGNELISATGIKAGQTVLIAGAPVVHHFGVHGSNKLGLDLRNAAPVLDPAGFAQVNFGVVQIHAICGAQVRRSAG